MSLDTTALTAKPFAARKNRKVVSAGALAPVAFTPLNDHPCAPMVITPNGSNVDLVGWLQNHIQSWQTLYYRHGALLFRGFGCDSAERVAKVAAVVMSDLFKDNTEHQPITTDGLVQIPVDYAKDQFLMWHNENTFNYRWPQQAIFACARAADEGGETPVADSRDIYNLLDDEIRQAFVDKQVMYVRKYGADDRLGLGWKTIFNTEDKSVVERACREQKMQFEWRNDNELLTRSVRPAVWQHPVNGQWCWVNQALHWHVACLPEKTRSAIASIYPDELDYPRNCYFGDGSKIPDDYIHRIMALYREQQMMFPWQPGDLLLVDNILKAHARNPFKGERQIMVCFGGMEYFS